MRSRNVIIIAGNISNDCFKMSFTLRISKRKKNTTLLSNIRIKYRSSRMHFKNMSSEWTKAHMHCGWLFGFQRDGGWQRDGGGARRGYGSNGKIRSILFQTSLKHGVDMPDSPGLSRTCGVG